MYDKIIGTLLDGERVHWNASLSRATIIDDNDHAVLSVALPTSSSGLDILKACELSLDAWYAAGVPA